MYNLNQLKSSSSPSPRSLYMPSSSQAPPPKPGDESPIKQLPSIASSSSFRIDDILLKNSTSHAEEPGPIFSNRSPPDLHHQISNMYNYFTPMLMGGKAAGLTPDILSLIYNGLNNNNSLNRSDNGQCSDPRIGFKQLRRPDSSFSQAEINKWWIVFI